MKFILILLISVQAFALPPYSVDVDTSINNLSPTYNTSFPQLALGGLTYVQRLSIVNGTAIAICCNTVNPSTSVAPSVGDGHELCVPGNSFFSYDNVNINTNVYCRGESLVNAGKFRIQAW